MLTATLTFEHQKHLTSVGFCAKFQNDIPDMLHSVDWEMGMYKQKSSFKKSSECD